MNVLFDKVLSTAERKSLPSSAFALPEMRALPIPDLAHARAALSRVSQMLGEHKITRAQHNSALNRIYAKYPALKPRSDAAFGDVAVWFDAGTSSFGWKVGDKVAYTYRSAKSPEGTVTAVHPGTTRDNTTISIRPQPHWHFGEGIITRHITKVRHISAFSANAHLPPEKDS